MSAFEGDNLASANIAADRWRFMRMTVIMLVFVAMVVAVMMVRMTKKWDSEYFHGCPVPWGKR
jgi:hypothetical protein